MRVLEEADFDRLLFNLPPAVRRLASGPFELDERTQGIALEVDGRVLAIGGITRMHEGVGEVWGLLAPAIHAHPIFLHKAGRRLVAAGHTYRRLQATAAARDLRACRWLARLGFEREGLMRAFGPDGADHVRYARVASWHS